MRTLIVTMLLLAACAGRPAEPRPLLVPSPVTKSTPREPAPPARSADQDKADFRAGVAELTAAVHKGDLAAARAVLARLRAHPAGQARLSTVVYYEAALHAYAGDFAATATLM